MSFVMQFPDGRFVKNTGAKGMDHKSLSKCRWWNAVHDARLETYITADINEAKIFKSKRACTSHNSLSWGAKPKEVTINITLK